MLPLLVAGALAAEPAESDLVYFVLIDRFADGETDTGPVDPGDPHAFHGGDLVGLTERLPYLYDLGVRTLWLSPVFNMRTEKFHGHGAFHGYWVNDLDGIEPRFGGDAAMIALAEQAEAMGIRLILDMVYNHTAFDAPRVDSHPHWFHADGTIEDWNDPVQLTRGMVHGLPDLAQEEPEVYDYLLSRSLHWAQALSADGFRIDAVRHMDNAFFHALSADLKAELGEDFWLLGEDFQGDARLLSQTFAEGGFDAMFDFPVRYALVDVICGDSHPGRLASTLTLDALYDNPAGLVTFLDNHDLPRIASDCGGDRGRVEMALLVMFALRGTPAITYGTEWLLEGPGEPENRADMPWDGRGPLADTIADLAAMRAEHPFLAEAAVTIEAMPDRLLWMRLWGEGQGAHLVVNMGESGFTGLTGEGLLAREGQTMAPFAGVIPPRSVALVFSEGVSLPLEPEPARVSLKARGLRGEQVVLVGAGEVLGHWDPAQGLPLPATITVPTGTVLSYKLVRIDGDGAVHWEQTDNRYSLVARKRMRIRARWEEER